VLRNVAPRFLLVHLSIEAILQETAIYQRRQRLSPGKNILNWGDAYKGVLGRIKAQSGERARLGMTVLMWILHSRRPLQVEEICHAVAIRIGSNDLDNNDVTEISTLIGCCQGLITIDRDTSTIRLIHFTFQEYLCAHPNLFGRVHSTIAETCLTYLNFQHVKALSAGTFTDPQATPFPASHTLPRKPHPSLNILLSIGEPTCEWSPQTEQKHLRSSSLISSIITCLPNSFGSRSMGGCHLPMTLAINHFPHCTVSLTLASLKS